MASSPPFAQHSQQEEGIAVSVGALFRLGVPIAILRLLQKVSRREEEFMSQYPCCSVAPKSKANFALNEVRPDDAFLG